MAQEPRMPILGSILEQWDPKGVWGYVGGHISAEKIKTDPSNTPDMMAFAVTV